MNVKYYVVRITDGEWNCENYVLTDYDKAKKYFVKSKSDETNIALYNGTENADGVIVAVGDPILEDKSGYFNWLKENGLDENFNPLPDNDDY